ncbi:MAG: hypothetical protein AB7O59_13480 [Pirellulales bacterium]
MKLVRTCDVVPDGSGLVCRQTRFGGVLLAMVFTAFFAGPTGFAWWVGAPAIVWIVGAVLTTLLVLTLAGDVRARYRPSNWVLWVRPDGLWIHFRSYQDQSATDGLAVVELEYREIATAGRLVERYSTPDSDHGSVRYKLESLEFVLREADSGELAAALAENRRREQPWRSYLGFIRGRSKPTLYSVTQPTPAIVRVAWHGGQHHGVWPSLRRVLEALGTHVEIAEPIDEKRADWSKLTDDEIDNQILEFVRLGNRMEAVKLLVRRRGYSLTKAHQFVEELGNRA